MKRIIILLVFTLFSVVIVSADGIDDQGNPNDPNVNDRANACFEGGSMEGKCDTPWEWVCGWHLIQFEYDLTTREDFPNWCISILPPEILPEELAVVALGTPSTGCEQIVPFYADFSGGYFVPAGLLAYAFSNCTNVSISIGIDLIFAPAPFDALTLCNLNGTYSSATLFAGGTDIYVCNP